jgi:hypothetical protein
VPKPVDRDRAGDGDGRGVQHLADGWPDEGDTEQILVIEVDDHSCAAGVAVGVELGPGDDRPISRSTTCIRWPAR